MESDLNSDDILKFENGYPDTAEEAKKRDLIVSGIIKSIHTYTDGDQFFGNGFPVSNAEEDKEYSNVISRFISSMKKAVLRDLKKQGVANVPMNIDEVHL